MARWAVFAGLTALVLFVLLALARASQSTIDDTSSAVDDASAVDDTISTVGDGSPTTEPVPSRRDEDVPPDSPLDHDDRDPIEQPSAGPDRTRRSPSFSTGALLANVALSQGLFAVVLVGGAWYARIPPTALGVRTAPLSTGLPALGIGIVVGIGLYLVNELGTLGANAVGIETPDALRESLAPDSRAGWIVLLGVVLPTIAIFEELLFRAALIGALSAGFGLSPWLLAVLSSVAFALGHGAQGTIGMVATGGLGFVLAGAFVLTGSLLVVVVAHYLVNALEFAVHESLGVEWS
ncbi:CPBP family intramembrane glutamic endopeptidase [Halococcus saccharolyticus]|uniref:Putative protease n=1 Tax=Halococcus saccharolyticus DSM 5350 TaxID=1227455 RepID=M0MD70_9EURY|nr:type II CAAX endopeptidase family protein [Halococcus saccharolyticus]EMA43298.1 putative protease [Halococcus saccharolyticus DSM 5350]